MGLKGQAKIELTNVKTGDKQVVVENNMVTNALKYLVEDIFALRIKSGSNMLSTPLYQTYLSGVLLFDKHLTEDPDNVYASSEATMIGKASNNAYTGMDATRGSYNEIESGKQEDGSVKLVWDFGTSQANGTISSLSLTSALGGVNGYGSKGFEGLELNDSQYSDSLNRGKLLEIIFRFPTSYTVSGYGYVPVLYHYRNNEVYLCRINVTNKELIIIKCRREITTLNTLNTDWEHNILEQKNIPFPEGFLSGSSYSIKKDPDGMLYIINKNSGVDTNASIRILKVNILNNYTLEEYVFTNTKSNYINIYIITNNKIIYNVAGDYNSIYYKDLSNNTEGSYQFQFNNETLTPLFLLNGYLYVRRYKHINTYSYYEICQYNTKTNKVMILNNYEEATDNKAYMSYGLPLIGNKLMMFINANSGSWYDGLVYFRNYLATINNLATSVEKTPEKTMKITYILREE